MSVSAQTHQEPLRLQFDTEVEEAFAAFLTDPHYLIDMVKNSQRISLKRKHSRARKSEAKEAKRSTLES